MPSDFLWWMVTGSYAMGAALWVFMYREVSKCRQEIEQLGRDLAFYRGKDAGADLDARVTRLERVVAEAHPH